MANIILSIAIPTFDRCMSLKEELESLLPQLISYRDKVEIVISDNASPNSDHTESMVKELEKKYEFPIRYNKLSNSIYFEDNFKEVVSKTQGKYILMTGDDDLFAPNYIETLFGLIDKNFGLIHFNRLIGDDKCTNTRIFDKNLNTVLYEGDTAGFIRLVMRSPGFMSSLVFRRDCWETGKIYEKDNYYGYHFLGRLYHGALVLEATSCYYYMPMLIERKVKHDWGTMFPLFFFVGYSNIFKDIDAYVPGVFGKWIQYLHKDTRKENYTILRAILKDRKFYSEKKKEFFPYLSKGQVRAYNFLVLAPFPPQMTLLIYKAILRFL